MMKGTQNGGKWRKCDKRGDKEQGEEEVEVNEARGKLPPAFKSIQDRENEGGKEGMKERKWSE